MVERTATTAVIIDSSGAARGAEEFERAGTMVKAANDEMGRSGERLVAIIGDQTRKLDALRKRLDPAAAAAARMKKEQDLLNRALSNGRIDVIEHTKLMKELEGSYNTVSAAERDRANELDKLRAKFDPLFATTERYQKELADLEKAQKAGIVVGTQYTAALESIEHAFNPQIIAAKKAADAQEALTKTDNDRIRTLNNLRAKFDPVYAASKRYQDAVEELAAAERQGALQGVALAEALDRIEQELNPTVVAARKAAEAEADLANRARALVESLNPAAKAQRDFNASIAEADTLLARGKLTVEEHAQAVAHAEKQLNKVTGAQTATGKATKLTAYEMQQLSFQINDVVAQLASGSNPLMIIGQQGGQVSQIFGGLRGTLTRLGPLLLRALPAAPFVAAGIAAGVTAGRISEITGQMRRLDSIARTVNPGIAGMADELRALTLQLERAGVPREDAIKLIETLARAKGLQVDLLKGIAVLSVDMAASLNKTPEQAAEMLIEGLSKGVNGVKELDEALNSLLKPDQVSEINRLDRTGHRAEAMAMALDLLVKKFGGDAGRLRSEWDRVINEMDSAYSGMLEGWATTPWIGKVIGALTGIGTAVLRFMTPGNTAGQTPLQQSIESINADIGKLKENLLQARKAADAALNIEPDLATGQVSDAVIAATNRVEELERQLRALEARRDLLQHDQSERDAPHPEERDSRGMTGEQAKRIKESTDAYNDETKALRGTILEREVAAARLQAMNAAYARNAETVEALAEADLAEQRVRRDRVILIQDENTALDRNISSTLQLADAYRSSTEEGLRYEAMRQAVAESLQTGVDAADRARRILQQNAADAKVAGQRDLNDLKADNQNDSVTAFASGLSPEAQRAAERMAEAEKAYRDRVEAARASTDKALLADIQAQQKAYEDALKAKDDYAKIITTNQNFRSLSDEVAMLEREAGHIGESNEQHERENDLLRTRQDLIDRGYSGKELDAEYDKLGRLIIQRSKLNALIEKQTRIFESNKQAILDSTDILRDGFDDLVLRGERFTDVLKNMSQQFLQLGTDLLVMEPLKNFLRDSMNNTAGSGGGTNLWSLLSGIGSSVIGMWGGASAAGASAVTGVTSATAGGFGGAPTLPVTSVPLAHTGWLVGAQGAQNVRTVPSSIFVNAPRFHRGGIVGGERAAILRDGEEVLTARNPRHRRNFQSAGNAGPPTIVMNISTPDANSFRRSESQLAASAGRAVMLAQRRNG